MARLLISNYKIRFPRWISVLGYAHYKRISSHKIKWVLYASNMFCEKLGGKSLLGLRFIKFAKSLAKNPNLQIIVKKGVKPVPKAVEPSSTQTANHQESAVSFQQESDATTKFESHLNRKHLFENFVEGKSNQLARAVGQNSLLHQVNQRQTHSFIWWDRFR